MNDITELAQQAMTILIPLLPVASAAAGHLADGFLSEPGAKLFNWLTSRFQGTPPAATLERAVAEPRNVRRQDALRLEIEELAERDAEFRRQLIELLKAATESGGKHFSQTANPTGNDNKVAQVQGSDNKIEFN